MENTRHRQPNTARTPNCAVSISYSSCRDTKNGHTLEARAAEPLDLFSISNDPEVCSPLVMMIDILNWHENNRQR